MSIASVAATQSATAANAAATAATPNTALGQLSANMNTFLNLLMTQLQNQDPSSPLDSSQFTSQLVQYSSVEQAIQTNTNLTNLIQLTQGNEVVQSAGLLGKHAEVASSNLSLQNGSATVNFDAPAAGPATVVVTNGQGQQIATVTLDATKGENSFTWNGTNSGGGTEPDGSYGVTVVQTNAAGANVTDPTTVVGTVTGVTSNGTAVTIDMGALSVDFSALRALE